MAYMLVTRLVQRFPQYFDKNQIYVAGLPQNTTEDDLAKHFGSIGVIKQDKQKNKPKIWLYRDKGTGLLKGDGTVSYEDPFSAASAVEWFNGKEFLGSTISVSLAESYAGKAPPAPRGRGGGGYPRNDEPPPRDNGYHMDGGAPPGPSPMVPGPPPRLPGPPLGDIAPPPAVMPGPPPAFAPPPPGPVAFPQDDRDPSMAHQGMGGPNQQRGGPGVGGVPPAPKELREGDWQCPGCGNTNFAFRGNCNRCKTPKPGGGGFGRGRGRGRDDGGRGRGRGRTSAAPQGPPGMFNEGDWTCSGCGNTNWARRNTCNMCNGPKPGTVDTNREGVGGGFKELDEAEMNEAKKRRQETEDQSMYDEFGRLKKKFRKGQDRKAREDAALARLRGDIVPGEEADEPEPSKSPAREKSSKDTGSRRDREKEKPRERGRSRDRERDRDRSRSRGRDRSDRERDRDRDRRR